MQNKLGMNDIMGSPKLKDIKLLFALSGNQCAMPGCYVPIYNETGVGTGEICHICAAKKGGPRYDSNQSETERHAYDNLILLCRNHHTLVDQDHKTYTVEALKEIKSIHESYADKDNEQVINEASKALLQQWTNINIYNNSGNIAINSPGTIQGETINIKTTRKQPNISPPPDSIGADTFRTGYIQHLIKRYNKYASENTSRAKKFSFGAISKNLEDKFGTSWRLVHISKFNEVVSELHRRIDRTQIARMNKGKNRKSYSTYEEYLKKHGYG